MVAVKTDRNFAEERRELRLRIGSLNEFASIFKYVSLDGKRSWNYFEQMCSQYQLIGSTLNSLNDPLEGKARIFDDLVGEKIAECCWYYDNSGTLKNVQSDKRFPDFDKVPSLVDQNLENILSSARILSFCRRVDSHLLWSHYANSHEGACIHFNISAFSDPKMIAGGVTYSDYRPTLPKSLLARIALANEGDQHVEDRRRYLREIYESLFFTKPSDWSYEQEVRIIYLTSDMTNISFNPAGLFEIVLGARASEDTEARVRAMSERYLPGTPVRRAFLSKDTFSVGIND